MQTNAVIPKENFENFLQQLSDKFDETFREWTATDAFLKTVNAKSITLQDWNALIGLLGRTESYVRAYNDSITDLVSTASDVLYSEYKNYLIQDARVVDSRLIITLQNGDSLDAGSVAGPRGEKGEKGDKGDDFKIVATYPTLAAMWADGTNTGVKIGDYVAIQSDVTDGHNASVYVKLAYANSEDAYRFLLDLSGMAGVPGKNGKDGLDTVYNVACDVVWDGVCANTKTWRWKVCSYKVVDNPHMVADLQFRFVVGTVGFRYDVNFTRPYGGRSVPTRMMFVKPRVLFEDASKKAYVTHFRAYEADGSTGYKDLWVELFTNGQPVQEAYAKIFAKESLAWELHTASYNSNNSPDVASDGDSLTVKSADWGNKNAVLSLDSRATAEGAIVSGRGNRVEAEDAASFGSGGKIGSTGVASLQTGTDNTNSGHDAVQGGKDNTNSGPMSAQVGNDNDNSATDTFQAGCRNTNKAADTVQVGSDNTNSGEDTLQGGGGNTNEGNRVLQVGNGNTNSGADTIQGGYGNTNKGDRVSQVGNGNYNEANDCTQSGVKNYNYGSDTVMFGHTQTNKGQHSYLHGYENYNTTVVGKDKNGKDVYADYVDMHGTRLNATRRLQMLRGQWSKDDARALAIWGNGTSETDRKNVFTIAASGTPEIATDGVNLGYLDSAAFKQKILAALPIYNGEVESV